MSAHPSPLGSLLVLLIFGWTNNASISTIRTLTADAAGKANSGQPCCTHGYCACIPCPLHNSSDVVGSWNFEFYDTNPTNSKWFNRDRLVPSNGHYTLMHLLEYKPSMDGLVTPKAPSYFRNIG
ncbi:transketolase [Suillus occidentalis]|nr:transketolase [Suillus occidentalis]KAG1719289.1 transketolase [Suillus occidentalis]